MHSKLKTAADLFSVSTFQTQWKHRQNILESHTIMNPRSNSNHTKNITQVLLIFFPTFFLCKRKKTLFLSFFFTSQDPCLSLSPFQISLFFCVIEHIYSTFTVHFSATCLHVFWKFYWGSNKEVVKVNYEGWTWMNKVYGFREVWTTGVFGTWKKKPSFVTKTKNLPQSHTPPNNKNSKVLLIKNKNPSQSQS